MESQKRIKRSFALGVIFLLLACVMLYKGYDKMTNYVNSEYSYVKNVNAYVGGDAYNYIINAGYSTGYFVLAMGFFIVSSLNFIAGIFIDEFVNNKLPASSLQQANEHQLPPL